MDPELKHRDYTCPLCGEKAVLGSHFCTGSTPQAMLGPRKARSLGPLLVVTAGCVVATAVLWHWLGAASLLVLAGGLVPLLWRRK